MYGILAEVVMWVHLAYVLVVVAGQLAILVGIARGWHWVRNVWFRAAHLLMIGIVTFEAALNINCVLLSLECYLREQAGQPDPEGAFLARFLDMLSLTVPEWAYNPTYICVGMIVAVTFVLAPPRRTNAPSISITDDQYFP